MKVYEIFIPEVGTYVKFKQLQPEDTESFVNDMPDVSKEEFMKRVLANFIFNMKSEIVDSLKMMSRKSATATIEALYNGCVMLNPGLEIDNWIRLSYSIEAEDTVVKELEALETKAIGPSTVAKSQIKKISKSKFLNLEKYLKERVIGQNHAIEAVVSALKRSQTGLNDANRPLGVFLFAGSSGIGKTHLARELHAYLFGDKYDIIRVDCGEFQHKHENQKLMGSPPGYIGHDEGGQLTNQITQHPDTVVLLDEVEKAHPDLWNTFLRVFDEGIITNNKGEHVSFRNAIIIMTTNLGNDKIVDSLVGKGIGFTARTEVQTKTIAIPPRPQVERLASDSIRKTFRSEFLNRIDKIIVFNHLTQGDYSKIAELELQTIDDKLAKRGTSLRFDDSAINALIVNGVDTVKGARGMAQVRRDEIEDRLADILLTTPCPRGTIFEVSYPVDKFEINVLTPSKMKSEST